MRIDEGNLVYLKAAFDGKFIKEIDDTLVAKYQEDRLKVMSEKSVNLELATLRMILKKHGCWEKVSKGIGLSKVPESIGRVITIEEQKVLFAACQTSRSRQLFVIVLLAFQTGVRFGPLRTVRWRNIDFERRCIQWGKDKTPAGTGRIIPLNALAIDALTRWAALFPNRQPDHFVFAAERCGGSSHHFDLMAPIYYDVDPTQPIGSIKTAWQLAKKNCNIQCRFHDIRHTAVTALVNAGTPLPKVAKIMGWSPSQTIRMSLIYSHFSLDDLRPAMNALDTMSGIVSESNLPN